VEPSPLEQLLGAIDRLDFDAAAAMLSPGARLLIVDGRRADGRDAARELIADFMAQVRSTTHTITAQWHQDNVWIAESDADYVLKDWLELARLPRVFIARTASDGISDLRVYGAREGPLENDPAGGLLIGGRWIPPL
jgi:hypothetical protein